MRNHRIKLRNLFVSLEDGFQRSSDLFKERASEVKNYFTSDQFEDDLDYLILNLQMFDTELDVPNFDELSRSQRINRKVKLLRASLKRLNMGYAPIGMMLGATVGPKGAAVGSLLGSYIFAACVLSTVVKRFNESGNVMLKTV